MCMLTSVVNLQALNHPVADFRLTAHQPRLAPYRKITKILGYERTLLKAIKGCCSARCENLLELFGADLGVCRQDEKKRSEWLRPDHKDDFEIYFGLSSFAWLKYSAT